MKSVFLFLGLLFSTNFLASETMQCNFDSELGGGNDELISTAREKYSNLCLKCEGNSCKMNIFRPESDPDLEQKRKNIISSCKRIFCTPKKIRKIVGEEITMDSRIGQTKFEFSYRITLKGRVRDVQITSLEGVMNEREAYRRATGVTKRAVFIPIEIKGNTYEITNLSAVMEVNTGVYDGS